MEHEVPLRKLFSDYFREECRSVVQLPQAGSDRLYFRLESEHHSAIGTYGKDAEENATFLHHTRHFRKAGIAVPEIYAASETQEYYLQQDLGNHSLYQLIQKDGISVEVQTYLQEVLKQLAILQIKGAENFDFTKCYPIQQFDRSSMFWDMNSFKYILCGWPAFILMKSNSTAIFIRSVSICCRKSSCISCFAIVSRAISCSTKASHIS